MLKNRQWTVFLYFVWDRSRWIEMIHICNTNTDNIYKSLLRLSAENSASEARNAYQVTWQIQDILAEKPEINCILQQAVTEYYAIKSRPTHECHQIDISLE